MTAAWFSTCSCSCLGSFFPLHSRVPTWNHWPLPLNPSPGLAAEERCSFSLIAKKNESKKITYEAKKLQEWSIRFLFKSSEQRFESTGQNTLGSCRLTPGFGRPSGLSWGFRKTRHRSAYPLLFFPPPVRWSNKNMKGGWMGQTFSSCHCGFA